MLKTTTALTISLSLLQPGVLSAQGFTGSPLNRDVCIGSLGQGCPERLWQVQTCADDPTLPECLTEGAVVPEQGGEAAPVIVPEPEIAPEAVVVPDPDAVPSLDAEAPAETAPEPVAEPVVVQEPAPEAAPAPTAAEEPAAAPEAPPATEQEAVPAPEPEQAVAPTVEPAADAATAPSQDVVAEPPVVDEPAAGEVIAPETSDAAAPDAEPVPAKETVAEPAEGTAVDPVTEPVAEEPPALAPSDAAQPEPVTAPEAEVIPEATAEDVAVVEELMTDPEVAAAVSTLAETVAPVADAAVSADPTVPVSSGLEAVLAAAGADGVIPAPAATTTQTLNAAGSRTSTQDFTSALLTSAQPTAKKDDDKLSDLEKAGLFALGAVVVGMVIANNRVVANSGDRVIVDRGDGNLAIWKDDNANLRAPGIVETTDRFNDGSTLTTLNRPDGSQIITIRDATGRVLRRDRVNRDGSRVPLIDDTRPYRPVVVSTLPAPRVPELRLAETTDLGLLRALLAEAEQPEIGRTFSLAQVRDIQELRALAPELSGDPITFATGSSAIRPDQAGKLAKIGRLMTDMIADNPSEVFLVEGHTDAVGGAASNLALSDRRAESVALALTEIFGVPAENMVVQGYGERFLKVPSTGDEPRNRRVALRRITWLIDG